MTNNVWLNLLIITIQSFALFFITTTAFAYLTFFERRLLARLQNRVGPDRAGPGGFLQPLADAIKLFFKEDITPNDADKVVYNIAPALAMIPAILLFAVIPVGAPLRLFGQEIPLQLTDLNVGVLFLLAVTSIGVYGITLGGWSSNNKYSMLGGIRSSAQLVSYELALGLSVMVPVMMASSLSLNDIVANQHGWWNMFKPTGFVALCIFWLASTAEVVRAPFDLVEAEQELVGGYNTEYSSMKFALFFLGEYTAMIAGSALIVVLFFGGWHVPFLPSGAHGWIWGVASIVTFFAKVAALLFVFIWVRWTLPRFRFDQLMKIGWLYLFEIALVNIFLTAGILALVK